MMRKIFCLCIIVLFITACKNNGNDKVDRTIKIDRNQNKTQIDTIPKVIKISKKNESAIFRGTNANKATNKEFNTLAIKLNNKAIELYSYVGGEPVSNRDSLLLDSALVLLNKAIKIDTHYYLAYANKAMILSKLKKYTEAIKTLNNIERVYPNFAEGFAGQGFFYEKTGHYDKAAGKYQEAIEAYLMRLNKSYNIIERVNIQVDIAFMLLFTEGKDRALQLIDTIVARNPDNIMAKYMKESISVFNREEFMSNF